MRHRASRLCERQKDDLLAFNEDTDIYSSASPRCFTLQNLFPPSKGLKSRLDNAKVEKNSSTPRIVSHRSIRVLDD